MTSEGANRLTALMRHLVLRGNPTIDEIAELLSLGAECNGFTIEKDGFLREWWQGSILHLCVLSSRADLIPLFVKAGARLEQTNGSKYTPLLLAMECRQIESIACLLQHGARMTRDNLHFRVTDA